MNCEYCNNRLSSLSSLNYHKLNNKKCIIAQAQGKEVFKFLCVSCKKSFITKNSLDKHKCTLKNIVEEYEEYKKKKQKWN